MPTCSSTDPSTQGSARGEKRNRPGMGRWRWLTAWLALGGSGVLGVLLNSPLTVGLRPFDRYLAFGVPAAVAAATLAAMGRGTAGRRTGAHLVLLLAVATVVGLACSRESLLEDRRRRVHRAPFEQAWAVGRHVIAGFTDLDDIAALAAKGAVGGVYITQRNIAGKSAGRIAAEIRSLQAVRKRAGLPPLIVCADQEGGAVSRLSPPLTRLRALGDLLPASGSAAELEAAVSLYAETQARGLAALGINVNLGPVVDLRPAFAPAANSDRTQLAKRAISSDPGEVVAVALPYCRILEHSGIIPTLKHFPGLGRVRQDTHLQLGELTTRPSILSSRDWLPFENILSQTGAFMMVGHVRMAAVDPDHPASLSRAVVQGVIRDRWGHDGILMTDDLNMAPAYAVRGGIGAAAVCALNAGIDLVLVSYDSRQYYTVMTALLKALKNGSLDRCRLSVSDRRLARVATFLRVPRSKKSDMVAGITHGG